MLIKVDSEKAREEKWWHNPEYIIGEMNINSAITSPVSSNNLCMWMALLLIFALKPNDSKL